MLCARDDVDRFGVAGIVAFQWLTSATIVGSRTLTNGAFLAIAHPPAASSARVAQRFAEHSDAPTRIRIVGVPATTFTVSLARCAALRKFFPLTCVARTISELMLVYALDLIASKVDEQDRRYERGAKHPQRELDRVLTQTIFRSDRDFARAASTHRSSQNVAGTKQRSLLHVSTSKFAN